ncbi:hypothetical protein ACHAW5_000418 [Stephanodiscus triporus]|uniref:Mannosylglycerate hydrolase MGH1-like glycoside hydrolase domain-containing protein n=1 Tax=Stephanodiscus triporus TaxID=2934178 RepID=A0ABD3MJS2_9STRA
MLESSVLRKRNATSPSPSSHSTPQYAETLSAPRRRDSASFEKRKIDVQRPLILRVTVVLFALIVVFHMLLRYIRPPILDGDILLLDPIEILSTVPVGFGLDLPKNLSALKIFLDSRLVSTISKAALSANNDGHNFNFGTCDIKDHGENDVLVNHTFSLGQGVLDERKMTFLKPGNHVIDIQGRNDSGIIHYAQLALKVNSPPELILGSSTIQRSRYEIAYKLALKEVGTNIACNHFVAGSGWVQLWTRDTSYASELGASFLHPQVVMKSLMDSVEVWKDGKKVWLQDTCSHFGGWPILSDAIVGVRGAWPLYLVTGDKEFLSWAYQVTKASLQRAEEEALDKDTGLFLGCSSFLESNSGYPEKYASEGALVGKTKALSTNMLYYSGYKYAAKMGQELGIVDASIRDLEEKASLLKATIQRRLWSASLNNYAYFEDEYGLLVDHTEGLGSALALLEFDDDERNDMILKSTYTTEYGIPCLWPQFKYSAAVWEWRVARHYHNGRLWPFVQGYWAMAAAHQGRDDLFSEALKGITALSEKGNTFAEFYNLNGTFPEGRRSQLWSATGYLSMMYHGVFGVRLELEGIRFSPMKPKDLFPAPTIYLKELRYRGMILNIHLHGHGTNIVSFEVNHSKKNDAFIASDATVSEATPAEAIKGSITS